ncbi:MAG: hypothetical protein H7222_15590 [Methylotenera sp.]|nr:hypothetical protein [Oligoflexia bacterium]
MIATLPISERPRERCLQQGARCLSLRECLAILLGSGPHEKGAIGVANDVLLLPGEGFQYPEEERAYFTAMEVSAEAHLNGVYGLGPAGRAKLLASFEIARRYANFRDQARVSPLRAGEKTRKILDLPEQAFDRISLSLRGEAQEWLGFVPLYRSGKLGDFCMVERGVRTHVNVDPLELFSRILALRPQGFFLFHNHPSGDLSPSAADRDLTLQVRDLASRFGIRLLGHGVVNTLGERWIVL